MHSERETTRHASPTWLAAKRTAIASAPMLEIALLRICRAPCWPTCNTAAIPDRKTKSGQHCCVRRLRPPPGAAAAAQDLLGPDLHGARTRSVSYATNFQQILLFQAPIHPSALGTALELHKLSPCRPGNYNLSPKQHASSTVLNSFLCRFNILYSNRPTQ